MTAKGPQTIHDLNIALSPGGWVSRAACSPSVAEIFWPLPGQSSGPTVEAALKVCARCPVIRQCGQWALDNRQTEGIWGGMRPGALKRLVERSRFAKVAPQPELPQPNPLGPVHPVTKVPLKTHCRRNHPLPPVGGTARRWPCQACNAEATRRFRKRRREARRAEVASC